MPINTYDCPACPENCAAFTMPTVVSDDCVDSIDLQLGEIKRILVTVPATDKTKALGGPTDWTDSADWTTALHQTTASKVRSFYGIGDIPDPEDTIVSLHDGKTKVASSKFTLNFDILDLNDTNYEAARKFQCGTSIRYWYEDRSGYLHGGQDGIPGTLTKVTMPHERGNDAYKKIKFLINWNAKCSPARIPSPWEEVVAP